jgi:iron complex outermembrane receptor protein
LFDHRAHFNVTGFHQTFNNYPYRIPSTGVYYVNTVALPAGGTAPQVSAFNFVGAVPVEVNGVEGEFSASVTRNWDVSLVASYSLGKIKNGTIPCTDLNGDGKPDSLSAAPTLAQLQAAVGANNISACQVSQRAGLLPPFSASLQSEYRVPISPKLESFVRGLLTFNGSSQDLPTNPYDDVKAYGILDLFAGLRAPDAQWELNLFAKNVLNTTEVLTRGDPVFTSYQEIVFGPTGPIGAAAKTFTSTYTPITLTQPREFGLNFIFRFGSR